MNEHPVAMDFDQALAVIKNGLAQHQLSEYLPGHYDTLVLSNLLVKLVHRVAELERKLGEQT
jgi:hypothetical protein